MFHIVPPDAPVVKMQPGILVRRHAWPVRLMHWINVLAASVLFFSGLGIFNAFPQLHWGRASYASDARLLLDISARERDDGGLVGITGVLGREFDTTGWLGVSAGPDGEPTERAFPAWLTVPSGQWLAMSRAWHLFFAWVFVINGTCYLAYTLASGHLRRDLWPSREDWRSIGRSVVDHLRLRHPHGDAARRYNVLQKIAYLLVVFVLLPAIVVCGMAMSPRLDAILPGWVDALGGRDAARTLHFIFAWLLVAFVAVHLFEVLVSGPVNQLRSMITGRYAVPDDPPRKEGDDARAP